MRLGVRGSLSATSSISASKVRIATPDTEPMRASGRSSFSQPKYTAHAVAAGAVSARRPAKKPMRKARSSVIVESCLCVAILLRAVSHSYFFGHRLLHISSLPSFDESFFELTPDANRQFRSEPGSIQRRTDPEPHRER